ncbi:hypothetical protein [Blochmannia endosymbiont of Polyrhachis (Hedomyrma) turneri]|uniref:hypothetical protein n=1 Tax=Blochmannia endosymbiont of Polyrhachis (Hedomyrma) turneri TaxID=1505596 RepID=UPI00061A7B8F|nr:hypothetical protein [Blochmannia endosymbiont of Polyrhachis (Hedomyrma) turneri]AKC59831.1 protein visC [Blochmannia endosymbiont of Polyrhachis (Hedomyrma) turneri]
MKNFDIIITGQTISGLALACGLPRNFKIAILNNQNHGYESDVVFDSVVKLSMISIAVFYLLRFLKVWDTYIIDAVTSYCSVNISEKDSFNSFTFNCLHVGYPCLGYIVDSSIIYKSLLFRAHSLDNIFFINNCDCYTTKIIDKGDMLCVVMNNRYYLLAKLLVITDSCLSFLHQNLGIPVTYWHYPYSILLGTVCFEHPHSNIVRYVFQKKNILVLLPLMGANSYFVFWLLFSDSLNNFHAFVDKKYWNDLFMRSCYELGKASFEDNIKIFPCVARYARHSSVSRLLLLGDIVYDISPFKYQSINTSLIDVALLLGEIYKFGKFIYTDIGYSSCLCAYERNRRKMMMKFFKNIQYMRMFFSGDILFQQCVRATVFRLMNEISPFVVSSDISRIIIGFNDIPNWLLTNNFDD